MTHHDWADDKAERVLRQHKKTPSCSLLAMIARALRAADQRGYARGRAESSAPTMLELGCENEDAHRAERAP